MKVFVSSTCYDLLDLRAEVEAHLRDLGLRPVLSDRVSSEFEANPTADSIETCLANVRSSDVFICILSQRYGPSLAGAGFGDVAATHLEWQTARDTGKPIFMYVRDRTEGEATTLKKNRGTKIVTPWVQDAKLFEFLEEHKKLEAKAPRTNWIWTFRDSPELKARLSLDLRAFSSRAALLRWIEDGRLPVLRPQPGNRQGYGFGKNTFAFNFVVRGNGAALGVQACFDGNTWVTLGDLERGAGITKNVEYDLVDDGSGTCTREIVLRYTTTVGATIEDTFACKIPREGTDVRITLTKKRLVEGLGFEIV